MPVAFFSRELNGDQWRHSDTEKELLGMVETLKEFKGNLLG